MFVGVVGDGVALGQDALANAGWDAALRPSMKKWRAAFMLEGV